MRPEHMIVTLPGPDTIAATVDFSEYLGGTRFLYCQLEDGQSLVVEQRDGPNYAAGDRLSLSVPSDQKRYFGADGRRLR
jgi:lactose/L-arabinose transport system ATP-binding protein